MRPRNAPTTPAAGGATRLWRSLFQTWFQLAALAVALLPLPMRGADKPWNFAVQVSATVDAGKSQVTLQWPAPDPLSNDGYAPEHTVYRKRVSELADPNWGTGTPVTGGQNTYTDTVEPGVAYEYKVERHYSHWGAEYFGYGYVRTGINLPLVENRGTVLVVVESGVAGQLSGELDQLTTDLAGDGWRVVRIDSFSSTSTPADLQARIRQEYNQSGGDVQAVFLIGHLPVVLSGTATNPDGHFIRPMPADTFYGDVSGDWGTPTFDGQHWVYPANVLPTPLALAVGRVDFADMPSVYQASGNTSEIALLKNYLNKDHAFRTAQRVPAAQALIGDAFGEYYWEGVEEPFSADAYRNFAPLVAGHIAVTDNYHDGQHARDWIEALADNTYLWAYGCGPGGDSGASIGLLGANGGSVTGVDLVARDAKADFYLMFGSFIVDWSQPDNLLRAALAAPDYGLACAWSGRPFLYFHAMGVGETIGYGLHISENESGTLYETPVTVRPSGNQYLHGVYLALLGDPTLRLQPIAPVSSLTVDTQSGTANWSAPSDGAAQQYRVYWLNPDTNRYDLQATLGANTTSYTPTRTGEFMVRAVTLETGSGTYWNASEGVFWGYGTATSTPAPTPPPQTTPPPSPAPQPTPQPPAPVTTPPQPSGGSSSGSNTVGPPDDPPRNLPKVRFGMPIP